MPTLEPTTDTLPTIAWLDADNVISAGWSLVGCDPFKLAKNEYGFLLDYIYKVPVDMKTGLPILTLAAYDASKLP